MAHTTTFSDFTINTLINNDFFNFQYILIDFLERRFTGELLLAENIKQIAENESDHYLDFLSLNSTLINSKKLNYTDLVDDYKNIFHKHLYFYFSSETIKFIPTRPFLVHEQDNFYHYDDIVEFEPSFNNIFTGEKKSIKFQKHAFSEIIEEDIDILTPSIQYKLKEENNIFHNVIEPTYKKFVGRTESKKRLLLALEHKRIYLITISGIGGVGKSALVIKTVQDLIDQYNNTFSFIIWVSAKITELTPDGIESKNQTFQNLNQLLDIILKITDFTEGLNYSYQAKRDYCIEVLSIDKFLLIVDNFETIPKNKVAEFIDFFEEVGDRCMETKILITTRHQLGESEKVIDLKEFSFSEYVEFVNYLYYEKFCSNGNINTSDIKALYENTGGLPLATEFFIGQLKRYDSLKEIINKIKTNRIGKDDILKFSFEESFSQFSEPEQKVVFAISLLEYPDIDNISYIAEMDEFDIEDILSNLKKKSFVNDKPTMDGMQYSILPLTKAFLLRELDNNNKLNYLLKLKAKEFNYILSAQRTMSNETTISINSTTKNNLSIMLAQAAHKSAKLGNFSKSEEFFKQAFEYNSTESAVWYYKAIVSRDFAQKVEESSFEKAIKFSNNPEDKNSIAFEYGKTLFSFNKYQTCINILSKIPIASTNVKSISHYIGKAYFEIGKKEFKVEKKEK
jgi:hypothetical protein